MKSDLNRSTKHNDGNNLCAALRGRQLPGCRADLKEERFQVWQLVVMSFCAGMDCFSSHSCLHNEVPQK